MKELLTPHQVAKAIQVSESSVKRWCDKGVIPTSYTGGGHRRIPLNGLIEFLRSSKHELVRPEIVGLPANKGQSLRIVNRAETHLLEALVAGDEERCRRITLDLYLAEHSIASICDLVFSKAFTQIGEIWACGSAEVYQERRGCEIAMRVIHEMRMMVPQPASEAPLAIGGAIQGDQYSLATAMVELVLRDAKWNANSLGDNLPFDTMKAAIDDHRPRLFWLSVSYIADEEEFLEQYADLYEFAGMTIPIVVGGRALTEPIRQEMKYSAYCDNMQHLEAFAQTLLQNDTTQ